MQEYGYNVNNIISNARRGGVDFVESFAMDLDTYLYERDSMSDDAKKLMDKLLNFLDEVLVETVDCECESEWRNRGSFYI